MRLRMFTEPQQGASYATQLRAAQAAEAAGFDAYFRSDHYLKMGSASGLPGPSDAWVTLAGLARETSTIRLGTLVTSATFRLPGPLAITVAQVDAMSGGRVELGLGAGWYEAEHQAYAIAFPSLRTRFDRLEEQLEVLTGLWGTAEGERFNYQGEHYQVVDSPALPKPVQQPHPPIIIGGGGARRTPSLAARFAEEFNTPFLQPADAAAAFGRVRNACDALGRDPASLRYSSAVTVACARSDAELRRRVEAMGWKLEDLQASGACGSPDQVVERLGAYGEAGASVVYLQVLDLEDLDHVDLLGSAVLPQVA